MKLEGQCKCFNTLFYVKAFEAELSVQHNHKYICEKYISSLCALPSRFNILHLTK
jgi:hypothetical protein